MTNKIGDKPTEERITELEEGLESLLSISIKQMRMFSDAHTAFVKEISRLKDKVEQLEKNL